MTNLSVNLLLKINFCYVCSSFIRNFHLNVVINYFTFMGSLYLSGFILFSFAVLWRLTSIRLPTWQSSDFSNFLCLPSLKSVYAGRSHSFEFAYIQYPHWQLACKISDKQVENRILEAVPNQIADQIVVGLVGNKTKADLMEKIKKCMVKKRSIFLYRSDFHKLTQNRGELPERYAARIR